MLGDLAGALSFIATMFLLLSMVNRIFRNSEAFKTICILLSFATAVAFTVEAFLEGGIVPVMFAFIWFVIAFLKYIWPMDRN